MTVSATDPNLLYSLLLNVETCHIFRYSIPLHIHDMNNLILRKYTDLARCFPIGFGLPRRYVIARTDHVPCLSFPSVFRSSAFGPSVPRFGHETLATAG